MTSKGTWENEGGPFVISGPLVESCRADEDFPEFEASRDGLLLASITTLGRPVFSSLFLSCVELPAVTLRWVPRYFHNAS